MAESEHSETAPEEAPTSVTDVSSAVPNTPGIRLARLAMAHILVVLLSLSAFAAADSWVGVSGLGIAVLLSVVTGVLAGIAVTNLVHEWFHLLGAVVAGGDNEPIGVAVKRFRRGVSRSGHLPALRARKRFRSPAEVRQDILKKEARRLRFVPPHLR